MFGIFRRSAALVLSTTLITAGSLGAADGYRGQLWGSSPESVEKGSASDFGVEGRRVGDALLYRSTFQGQDAVYKYIFRQDSLVMVAITSDLPWDLSSANAFRDHFEKSEKAVDRLLEGLRSKYGQEETAERSGTDSYMLWRNGATDIELIVRRAANYQLILSYSWAEYFKRLEAMKVQNALDEL